MTRPQARTPAVLGLVVVGAAVFALGFRLYLVSEEAYLANIYGERWLKFMSEIPRFL